MPVTEGRKKENRDLREPIFLAFEGIKTEPSYFRGLLKKIDREANVKLILLKKGPGKEHFTNPLNIIEMVEDYRTWSEGGPCSVELFVECILSDLGTRHGPEIKNLKQELKKSDCTDSQRKYVKDEPEAMRICASFFNEILVQPSRPRHYLSDESKFCIIVDRDPGSFNNNQCEKAYEICEKEGLELIVSSPSFETWLLLHLSNVSKSEILKNKEANMLKGLLAEKTKQEDDALFFELYGRLIPKALERLKGEGYCTDLKSLLASTEKNNQGKEVIADENIGTNMGILMSYIFNGNYGLLE